MRRKLRLRIYSHDAPTALLEMKQKQGSNQLKRSLEIKTEDAKRLAKGEYELLLTYKDDFAAECFAVMKRDTYLPRTIVEYHRKAYVVPENSIRITMDSQIRAMEGHMASFFVENPGLYPVLEPWKVILNEFIYCKFNSAGGGIKCTGNCQQDSCGVVAWLCHLPVLFSGPCGNCIQQKI